MLSSFFLFFFFLGGGGVSTDLGLDSDLQLGFAGLCFCFFLCCCCFGFSRIGFDFYGFHVPYGSPLDGFYVGGFQKAPFRFLLGFYQIFVVFFKGF